LWACQEERSKVWALALAFLLLGSAALQEVIEHRMELQSAATKALRLGLEEGSELVGMVILLATTVRNTGGLFGRTSAAVFEAVHQLRAQIAVLSLSLAVFLALYTSGLPDYLEHGRPTDTLAAFLFICAALARLRRFFATGENVGGRAWRLSGSCLVASVLVIDVDPGRTIEVGAFSVHLRMLLLSLLALLQGTVWALAMPSRRWNSWSPWPRSSACFWCF
jgi:hypothetical protein